MYVIVCRCMLLCEVYVYVIVYVTVYTVGTDLLCTWIIDVCIDELKGSMILSA